MHELALPLLAHRYHVRSPSVTSVCVLHPHFLPPYLLPATQPPPRAVLLVPCCSAFCLLDTLIGHNFLQPSLPFSLTILDR